jgi:hypothetical protein
MLYYTNILTLINPSDADKAVVAAKINTLGVPNTAIDNIFFFGTGDPQFSTDFEAEIAGLNFNYTFIFLFNPDGTFLKTKGIAAAVAARMEDILHNDI